MFPFCFAKSQMEPQVELCYVRNDCNGILVQLWVYSKQYVIK